MRQFTILDQDNEPLFETHANGFTASILQLYDFYVVHVANAADATNYPAAVYRDVQEAAAAITALNDFALKPHTGNQAFAFPEPAEPIHPLEIICEFSCREMSR